MSDLMQIKNAVQNFIDNSVTTVEQIHKAISDLPFETIEKIDPLEQSAKATKNIYNQTISGVYEAIRKVNAEVGQWAEQILEHDGAASAEMKPCEPNKI